MRSDYRTGAAGGTRHDCFVHQLNRRNFDRWNVWLGSLFAMGFLSS